MIAVLQAALNQVVQQVPVHPMMHVLIHGGEEAVGRIAHRAAVWLRAHLPADDHPKLDAVERNSDPGPARPDLERATVALLQRRPELLPEIRALLTEAQAGDGEQRRKAGSGNPAARKRRKTKGAVT